MFQFQKRDNKRFDFANFMDFQDFYESLTSMFIEKLQKLPLHGVYSNRAFISRPDLVIYEIYGEQRDPVQLWWLLLIYNKVIFINEIKIGKDYEYPSLIDIEKLISSLKVG